MVVTQQYLVGELSLLLSNVAAVVVAQTDATEVARLRREAETSRTGQLASIAARALHLIDTLCWASLSRGDVAAFQDQAEVSGRLYEFCVCSRLLEEC